MFSPRSTPPDTRVYAGTLRPPALPGRATHGPLAGSRRGEPSDRTTRQHRPRRPGAIPALVRRSSPSKLALLGLLAACGSDTATVPAPFFPNNPNVSSSSEVDGFLSGATQFPGCARLPRCISGFVVDFASVAARLQSEPDRFFPLADLVKSAPVARAEIIDSATGGVVAISNTDGSFAFSANGTQAVRLATRLGEQYTPAVSFDAEVPGFPQSAILFALPSRVTQRLADARSRSVANLLTVGAGVLLVAEARQEPGRVWIRWPRTDTFARLQSFGGSSVPSFSTVELYTSSGVDQFDLTVGSAQLTAGVVGLTSFVATGAVLGVSASGLVYPSRLVTTPPGFAVCGLLIPSQ